MEKFSFKLEKVLDYKVTVESYKKSNYGKIKRILATEEDKLEKCCSLKENLKKERNMAISNISVGNFKLYNDYINEVDKTIEQQKEKVENIEKKVEVAKDELIVASKDKRIFQKLKENQYDEYLFTLKKLDDKLTDSIVSFRVGTRQ